MELAGDTDRQTFVGELVEHVEHSVLATIMGACLWSEWTHSVRQRGCVHSLALNFEEIKCQDTGSTFLGQCQRTDWIGLCWAMLRRPVGTYGEMCSGPRVEATSRSSQSASTRSIHRSAEPQPMLGCSAHKFRW
jgi:hypothetical protein